MKTLPSFREILTGKSAIVACLFAVVLFASSCQKDELMQPAPSAQDASSAKSINPPQASAASYAMVVIDHLPGHGFGPNYKVTLMSDGRATFEGRANVPVLGTKKFNVLKERVAYIKNMFEAGHFFQIKDDIILIPDAPTIYTTYNNGEYSKTLVDMDFGHPQILIQIRRATEGIMQIDRFLAIKKPIHDASAQKAIVTQPACHDSKCMNPNTPSGSVDAAWNQPVAKEAKTYDAAWDVKSKKLFDAVWAQPAPQDAAWNQPGAFDNGWVKAPVNTSEK